MTASPRPAVLALTIGDPAGIGPEIVAKALAARPPGPTLRPLVVGDAGVLREVIRGCRLDLDVRGVAGPEEVTGASGTVEVLDLGNLYRVEYGRVDAGCGRAAVEYIETACALVRAGRVHGLVTGPISKEAIWAAGSPFPGATPRCWPSCSESARTGWSPCSCSTSCGSSSDTAPRAARRHRPAHRRADPGHHPEGGRLGQADRGRHSTPRDGRAQPACRRERQLGGEECDVLRPAVEQARG